jgi:predicted O-methyltransferase YrrM
VNPLIAKRFSAVLARYGWRVQRTVDGRPNPAHLWAEDDAFLHHMAAVRQRTLVHDDACYVLYRGAATTAALPGDIAEVGAYRGGTALLLARVAEAGTLVHIFDTFTGMPDTEASHDMHKPGDFADTSLSAVAALLAPWPDVRIHAGLFPETGAAVADRSFRLVHIDVDIHQSVTDCCEFFYPRMVPGGLMVFDDYGWTSTLGARTAVDEFFVDLPETPIYVPTGQAIVVRQGGR